VQFLNRYKWPIIVVGAIVVIVGFLAFRPDKLFVDDIVDESLSDAFTTTTTTVAPSDTTAPTTPTTTTTAPDPPSGPTVVIAGEFVGVGHSASGATTVYEQDGSFVLRLEDGTDIQNGPDLYVYLLASDDFGGTLPDDYIDLGTLKGNVGGQNYELPPDFDPEVYRTVLIWCLRFRTAFAASPMA